LIDNLNIKIKKVLNCTRFLLKVEALESFRDEVVKVRESAVKERQSRREEAARRSADRDTTPGRGVRGINYRINYIN